LHKRKLYRQDAKGAKENKNRGPNPES